MFLKQNKTLHFIVAGIIIVSFFSFLIKNRNHFLVPNVDVFQYISDGKQYLSFKLPNSIHPPPLWPIFICLAGKLLVHITEYPELASAHFLNITFATLIILNIFILIYPYSPKISLATIFLLSTNKIFLINSLNTTNEIMYGFFLTLTLILYQKKYFKTAYLLSGLLFLIRYEAIVLPFAIFTTEFLFNRKRFQIKNLLIPFSLIIFWLLILNTHNNGSSILQNAYIQEITNGIQNIPNTKPFKELIDTLLFNNFYSFYYSVWPTEFNNIPNFVQQILFPISIFLFFLFAFLKSKKPPILKIIYLSMILHIIFLTLFPNYDIRYQIPFIWALYLLIIDRDDKKIQNIIISALIIFNICQINHLSPYDHQYEKAEYRLVANWLNKQNFRQKVIVFIYDPGVLDYFIRNPKISLDFNSYADMNQNIFAKCNDQIECVINNISGIDKNNDTILVISTNYSSKGDDQIADKFTEITKHHITAFRDNTLSKIDRLKPVTTLNESYSWAKIYQYIPQ